MYFRNPYRKTFILNEEKARKQPTLILVHSLEKIATTEIWEQNGKRTCKEKKTCCKPTKFKSQTAKPYNKATT